MLSKSELERLRQMALKLGIPEAVVVDPREVPTAQWVRMKCQYGCGGYGKRLTCPPHSPTPEQTRKMLDEYECGLLLHGDSTADIRKIGAELERQIFLAGYHKAFAFLCGPCRLCEKCDTDSPCRHPYEARPAMEASGIDVFATARSYGLPIDVVTDRDEPQNHYGLVLIE